MTDKEKIKEKVRQIMSDEDKSHYPIQFGKVKGRIVELTIQEVEKRLKNKLLTGLKEEKKHCNKDVVSGYEDAVADTEKEFKELKKKYFGHFQKV